MVWNGVVGAATHADAMKATMPMPTAIRRGTVHLVCGVVEGHPRNMVHFTGSLPLHREKFEGGVEVACAEWGR